MNTKIRTAAIAFCLLVASSAGLPSPALACSSADVLAGRLLEGILKRDREGIVELANNPRVFDATGLEYLFGPPEFTFPGPTPLHSAFVVLAGKEILTETTTIAKEDGSKLVDIIYLPKGKLRSMSDLRSVGDDAIGFRDYVACRIEVSADGKTRMPHVCYAETDGL